MTAPLATDVADSCYLSPGNKLTCVLDSLVGAFGGEAFFGFFVAGLVLAPMLIAGRGDLSTPTVLLIFIGSVAVPMLPPQYKTIAYAIVVVGFTAGVLSVANRYMLSGAAR